MFCLLALLSCFSMCADSEPPRVKDFFASLSENVMLIENPIQDAVKTE